MRGPETRNVQLVRMREAFGQYFRPQRSPANRTSRLALTGDQLSQTPNMTSRLAKAYLLHAAGGVEAKEATGTLIHGGKPKRQAVLAIEQESCATARIEKHARAPEPTLGEGFCPSKNYVCAQGRRKHEATYTYFSFLSSTNHRRPIYRASGMAQYFIAYCVAVGCRWRVPRLCFSAAPMYSGSAGFQSSGRGSGRR